MLLQGTPCCQPSGSTTTGLRLHRTLLLKSLLGERRRPKTTERQRLKQHPLSPGTPWTERAVTLLRHQRASPHQFHCHPSQWTQVPTSNPGECCHGVRDAQGWGSGAPTGITCPLPALSSASPAQHPSVTQQIVGVPVPPSPPGPPPRARTAVEGVDPGQSRQASVAQRLHAQRSAPPAGSHLTTKAARAGGGGLQAQAGAGWEQGNAACPAAQRFFFCQGSPGKEVLAGDGSASRLPPLPRQGEPSPASPARSHASPPRCLGTGGGDGGFTGTRVRGSTQSLGQPRSQWGDTGTPTSTPTSVSFPCSRDAPVPAKPHQLKDAQLPDPSWSLSPGGASNQRAPPLPPQWADTAWHE